jgi:hypothetical protein
MSKFMDTLNRLTNCFTPKAREKSREICGEEYTENHNCGKIISFFRAEENTDGGWDISAIVSYHYNDALPVSIKAPLVSVKSEENAVEWLKEHRMTRDVANELFPGTYHPCSVTQNAFSIPCRDL